MLYVESYFVSQTSCFNFTVVGGAVFNDQLHRFAELIPRRVHALAYVLPQRLQVHGASDDLVVVLHHLGVDRRVERICLHRRGQVKSNFIYKAHLK